MRQIQTTLDEYVYTPDDNVVEGEIEAGKRYTESDFNRIIEIKERERKRVETFYVRRSTSKKRHWYSVLHKTMRWLLRDLINQIKKSKDPNYCQRVTANDGELR